MSAPPLVIDARGLRCPWPAVRAARALREHEGDIEVLADDPAASAELSKLAAAMGAVMTTVSTPFGEQFRLRREHSVNVSFTRNG